MISLLFVLGIFEKNSFAQDNRSIDYIREILRSQRSTFQFYLEVENYVFNPVAKFPLYQDIGLKNLSDLDSEKFFRQKVLFIRDAFIGIATYNRYDDLLHLYIDATEPEAIQFDQNVQDNSEDHTHDAAQPFSNLDIMLPSLLFLSKFERNFILALDYFKIDHNKIKLILIDDQSSIMIGDQQANMIIDNDQLKINQINVTLETSFDQYPLKIEFLDWTNEAPLYPRAIHYSLNNRLIKESKISLIARKGLTKIRNEMMNLHKQQSN